VRVRVKRGLLYIAEWWLRLPWPPPWRVWWLRRAGATVGEDTRVHRCHFVNLEVAGFRELRIGARAQLGPECLLDLAAPIDIGTRATLAPRVTVLTHSDPGASEVARLYPREEGPVQIGDDAWIGAGAVVMPGVKIGNAAVVGAGAVVTNDVAPNTTVVGVPARQVE